MAPRLTRTSTRLSTSTRLKVAYVAIAALDTWLSGSSNPRAHSARTLTKPLLMPTLAASLLTDPDAASSPLRTSTLVAQAAGWAGDVVLLGDAPKNFLLGSSSFALGHAAYISGFRAHCSTSPQPGPRLIAALWAVSSPAVAFRASQQDRRLGPAILSYSATLSATAAAATQLDPALPAAARRASLLGAGLFLTSDSLLGTRKFLLRNPPHALEAAVMATYTAAQFFLSQGAARAGRTPDQQAPHTH